jgi:hypothetical protein
MILHTLRLFIFISLLFVSCSLFSGEVLVFYHIPKCGGTTVASIVGQQFGTEEIYHKVIPKTRAFVVDGLGPLSLKGVHLLPLDRIDLKKTKYIHGHIAYSTDCDPPGAKNFTFLRNPVERVFSAYRYANPKVKLNFFDQYEQTSNLQVMRLTALPRENPDISLKEHLESAKRVLSEKFFFVGIVEEMEDSLHTLFKLMNWNPPHLIPQFNITKKTDQSLSDLYSYVYEKEWADRELYAFAKLLFQKHKKAAQNSKITPKNIKYIDTVHFNPDSPLTGEGWGYRELDQETNTSLRQSYIKNAFIQFPLLKKNYVMEFQACFPPAPIKEFLLLVNGHKIDYKESGEGKWKTFTALIPKKLITKKSTEITFYVSDLYVPSEHADVADHRKMGIGISDIHITVK